jgi:glyoxylase-like metal-dependent hydrolase (beta-lactamase superfamily II)
MSQTWRIGDVTLTRVIEIEGPSPGTFVLPDAVPASVREIGWLAPRFANAEGALVMSIHALVVESRSRRILVDTCVGNDKRRPKIPNWHERRGAFLADLAGAGFPRESIDLVVCTHLHVDHVGWNTMLENGRWVPTFPRARYLIGEREWAYWKDVADQDFGDVIGDSVRPVLDAGLVDLVASDHRLTDEVRLEPTPGHTPGHVSVRISSRGEEAVITGDLMHHPCQTARPQWGSHFDWDKEAARATRRAFLERHADRPIRVFGTHFATPSAGWIVRDGDAYRFVVEPPAR